MIARGAGRELSCYRETDCGHVSPCWLWTGSVNRVTGYAQTHRDGRTIAAHRASWEKRFGPIPAGLTLDHLCRQRSCINPEHLEPVSQRENTARGTGFIARQMQQTHCRNGHPLSGDNLYRAPRGDRQCRICRRAAEGRRLQRGR